MAWERPFLRIFGLGNVECLQVVSAGPANARISNAVGFAAFASAWPRRRGAPLKIGSPSQYKPAQPSRACGADAIEKNLHSLNYRVCPSRFERLQCLRLRFGKICFNTSLQFGKTLPHHCGRLSPECRPRL